MVCVLGQAVLLLPSVDPMDGAAHRAAPWHHFRVGAGSR